VGRLPRYDFKPFVLKAADGGREQLKASKDWARGSAPPTGPRGVRRRAEGDLKALANLQDERTWRRYGKKPSRR
jgi:hypothetical protein